MKRRDQMPAGQKNLIQEVLNFLNQRPIRILLGGVFLSTGLFFYYWLIVHPEYIQFAQQPNFFVDKRFFLERLQLPGGFLDYLASFLTDLYQIAWLGAIILAGLVLITFLLLRSVMRAGSWWLTPFLPSLLLIMVQAQYDYPIFRTLSFILALGGFLIYRDGFPQKDWIRFGITLLFMMLVYVLSPGAMLMLALLCILYEALGSGKQIRTRFLLALGYLSAAILLPLIAKTVVFLVPLRKAYFHHALFWPSDTVGTKLLLNSGLGFLSLILAGVFFVRREKAIKDNTWRCRIGVMQAGVAVLLLITGLGMAVERDEKQVLAIRYAAHQGQWERVSQHVNEHTVRNPLCLFHLNRALFHTGRMASGFFDIPQTFGIQGLFLDKEISLRVPLDQSDFFFELGHINEAERWASEALTLYGESSAVLKRLALVNILQDEPRAAVQYLTRLRKNPHSRSWTNHYLSSLTNPALLRKETLLQKLHAYRPKQDFIVTTSYPEIDLEKMLGQSPANRMAFEYLMTCCLLNRDLDGFIKNLLRFRAFTKTQLPRHYEEALIAYLALNKSSADTTASQIEIRKSTIQRFSDFERILSEYGGNSAAAYMALSQRYSDTFWFYLLYPTGVIK